MATNAGRADSEEHDVKLKTRHIIHSRVDHVMDFLDFNPRAMGRQWWVLTKGVM